MAARWVSITITPTIDLSSLSLVQWQHGGSRSSSLELPEISVKPKDEAIGANQLQRSADVHLTIKNPMAKYHKVDLH